VSNWVSKITIVLTLCAVAAHIGRSGAPARRTAHTDQLQCPAEDSAPECSASLSDATSNAFSNTAAATRRSISRDVNADCSEDQFRFWLPAGGSVVLGSLDKTAGQHSLKVTWRPALAEARNTSDAANFYAQPAHWDIAFIQTPSIVQPECSYPTHQTELSGLKFPSFDSEASCKTEIRDSRHFSIPCFTECGNFDRHGCGKIVATGIRTNVYLAEADILTAEVNELARTIAQTLDGQLRAFVESRLGQIGDVDDDQHLTVLLGSLSSEQRRLCEQDPINGCVRANDFLNFDGKFGGDIIYIDVNAPSGRDLTAILAHELAHAATFSAIRRAAMEGQTFGQAQSDCIPCWLNEAIAHYMEQLICPDSQNLELRIARFAKSPNTFPLVIPDNMRQTTNHRGPTRAAGCLFMQSVMCCVKPADLQLIAVNSTEWSESLKRLTGRPFAELFREWSTTMAGRKQVVSNTLSVRASTDMSVRGTSFCCCNAQASGGFLTINAPPESQPQVTVIHPCQGEHSAIKMAKK